MLSGTRLAALALAVAALVVSGCGKSGKTAATTPAGATTSTQTSAELPSGTTVKAPSGTPLSRAQLISQGDAICAHANKLVDTVNVSNRNEVLPAFSRALVYEAAEERELSQLVPPASMAHDWNTILNYLHRYVEYAAVAARKANAKDTKGLAALFAPAERVHANLNALAARDGFKVCSGTK